MYKIVFQNFRQHKTQIIRNQSILYEKKFTWSVKPRPNSSNTWPTIASLRKKYYNLFKTLEVTYWSVMASSIMLNCYQWESCLFKIHANNSSLPNKKKALKMTIGTNQIDKLIFQQSGLIWIWADFVVNNKPFFIVFFITHDVINCVIHHFLFHIHDFGLWMKMDIGEVIDNY